MGEKELGRALLQLDSDQLAGHPNVRQQTWKILERDRRRVWWLTAVTITLWAAAIGMVFLMLIAFGLVFPLQAKLRDPAQVARLPPEMQKDAQFAAEVYFKMTVVGVTVSVGILAMAALATILLVLASRRATLRQINASLLEISQQLKELQSTPPPAK